MSSAKPKDRLYWDYVQLDKILTAQGGFRWPGAHTCRPGSPDRSKSGNQLTNHQYHFIVVHQVYELWFGLILRELREVRDSISQEPVEERVVHVAVAGMERVEAAFKCILAQMDLLQTLETQQFLAFRDDLVPASGAQSYQWRMIENMLGLSPKKRQVIAANVAIEMIVSAHNNATNGRGSNLHDNSVKEIREIGVNDVHTDPGSSFQDNSVKAILACLDPDFDSAGFMGEVDKTQWAKTKESDLARKDQYDAIELLADPLAFYRKIMNHRIESAESTADNGDNWKLGIEADRDGIVRIDEHLADLQIKGSLRKALLAWLARTPIYLQRDNAQNQEGEAQTELKDLAKSSARKIEFIKEYLSKYKDATIANRAAKYFTGVKSKDALAAIPNISVTLSDDHCARIGLLFIETFPDLDALVFPHRLIEQVRRIDSLMSSWRNAHARVVERTNGLRAGTGGSSSYRDLDISRDGSVIFDDIVITRGFLLHYSKFHDFVDERWAYALNTPWKHLGNEQLRAK